MSIVSRPDRQPGKLPPTSVKPTIIPDVPPAPEVVPVPPLHKFKDNVRPDAKTLAQDYAARKNARRRNQR
jgi:hypothetical protein